MSDQIQPVSERIIDILRKNGVKRASFFGSIVRGEMTEDSDVDLLVEFEGRRSLLDLAHLKNELEDASKQARRSSDLQINFTRSSKTEFWPEQVPII